MGRRRINFAIEDGIIVSNFGNWIMLLVYAKSINIQSFLNLKNYNTPTDFENDEVNYNKKQLKLIIDFLDKLITELHKEKELREKYPESYLIELLNSDFEYIFLYEENNIFLNNESNIAFLIDLKTKILARSLQIQQPHLVYVL